VPGKTHGLTQAEEEACLNIIRGRSPVDAYRLAGFELQPHRKKIEGQARDFFRRPKIAQRIAELRAQVAEKAAVDGAFIIGEIMRLYQYAAEYVPMLDAQGKPTDRFVMRNAAEARKNLDLMGKATNLYLDRREIGKPGDFSRMTSDELREKIAERCRAAGLDQRAIDALLRAEPRGTA
jgi:hypothetical protein